MIAYLTDFLGVHEFTGIVNLVAIIAIIYAGYKLHDRYRSMAPVFWLCVPVFILLFGVWGEWVYFGGLWVIAAIASQINRRRSEKAAFVFAGIAVVLLVITATYLGVRLPDAECYTDWDGRSNPSVCN